MLQYHLLAGWHILWRSITLPFRTCSSKPPEFLNPEARNTLPSEKTVSSIHFARSREANKQLLFYVRKVTASGVSVWWRSRWCLQSGLHLLPVLTHPLGGRFPGCRRAAVDRHYFGQSPCFYLPPLHGASQGQLLRACKDVSGGGGGQGVGKEGGGYSHGWVACLQQEVSVPVLQLYSPIITFTIQRQLGAHAQEVSGDHITSTVCVCGLYNPDHDPSNHLCQSPSTPPAMWETCSMLADVMCSWETKLFNRYYTESSHLGVVIIIRHGFQFYCKILPFSCEAFKYFLFRKGVYLKLEGRRQAFYIAEISSWCIKPLTFKIRHIPILLFQDEVYLNYHPKAISLEL